MGFIPSIFGVVSSFFFTIGSFEFLGISLNMIIGAVAAVGVIILLVKLFL